MTISDLPRSRCVQGVKDNDVQKRMLKCWVLLHQERASGRGRGRWNIVHNVGRVVELITLKFTL